MANQYETIGRMVLRIYIKNFKTTLNCKKCPNASIPNTFAFNAGLGLPTNKNGATISSFSLFITKLQVYLLFHSLLASFTNCSDSSSLPCRQSKNEKLGQTVWRQ